MILRLPGRTAPLLLLVTLALASAPPASGVARDGVSALQTMPAVRWYSVLSRSALPHCAPPGDSAYSAAAASDLYCIELLPAAGIDRARGYAELRPAASPFGLAVTPAGTHVYDVALVLSDLPDPGTLGPYTHYVAWAMPPQLDPVTRLGVVQDGSVTGRVALDQFLILVTAEASPDVQRREGRLVLRGLSASMRMQPHDMAFVLAGLLETNDDTLGGGEHAHHTADERGWIAPPMNPAVAMPPGLMRLRPDVGPLMPVDQTAHAPPVKPQQLVRLADGDTLVLRAAPVRKVVNGRSVTMLGFNGQIPGPLVQVDEDVTVVVRFRNETTLPTAIHWHGIRLDNRFDGVPHVTQEPVPPGGVFDYTIHFPDAGLYWYHPHMREDVLQDLGLYGNLSVRSKDPGWLGPANREEFLILDDLLVGNAGLIPYGDVAPTHALMGRFGNVFLVNGEPAWAMRVRRGEVVRLWLTNVASTRVFNLSFDGRARMKVVASDLGRYEREQWVDNIVIAPAERYVVDVRFEEPGAVRLLNRVRAIDHIFGRFFPDVDTLGTVTVEAGRARPDHGEGFAVLRSNAAVTADIDRYRAHFDRAPDRTLHVTLEPGTLPFPLLPLLSMESVYRNPVEWSGTMPEMDWVATGRTTRWILRDPSTGLENMDIAWRFRVGDVILLRLVNERGALHAMQHPIHIHGQRFLVVSMNGVRNEHLVWKDTALLPTGFVMDILLEITNPGAWMIHCHIAEHIEAGMHMVMTVER